MRVLGPGRRNRAMDQRDALVATLLREDELSYAEIAQRFDMTTQRVDQIRVAHKIAPRGYSKSARRQMAARMRVRHAEGKFRTSTRDVDPDNVLAAQLVIEERLSYSKAAAKMLEVYGVKVSRSRVAGAVARTRRRLERERVSHETGTETNT
jgi:hypothetical protein